MHHSILEKKQLCGMDGDDLGILYPVEVMQKNIRWAKVLWIETNCW